ncbi:methyltransferase domain-containing protein [Nitratifractor sp.]
MKGQEGAVREDFSRKSLLDFMRVEPRGLSVAEPKPLSSFCEKLAPSPKDTVLMLGYDGGKLSKPWMERGVDLLIVCDRESDAVAARKEGFRAVLANAEYLWDRERFDGIVSGSPSYRIYDPYRAMESMIRALKPGGELRMELSKGDAAETTEKAIAEAAEALGVAHLLETLQASEAKRWREAAESLGETFRLSTCYRHHLIPRERLGRWVNERLRLRAVLLERGTVEALVAKTVTILESLLEGERALSEEEVLLHLQLRRT